MLAEFSPGVGSLKAAFDITKGLNAANTQAGINEVKIALQEHILNAQQALAAANEQQSAVAERIRNLEQEIMRLKDWSAEKERYHLQDIYRGAMAYVPKPGMENGEPPHWLCANCFNQGRKSFLQFKGQDKRPGGGNGHQSTYGCDACRRTVKVFYTVNPTRLRESGAVEEPEPRTRTPRVTFHPP